MPEVIATKRKLLIKILNTMRMMVRIGTNFKCFDDLDLASFIYPMNR
jgi:hypothetical protein